MKQENRLLKVEDLNAIQAERMAVDSNGPKAEVAREATGSILLRRAHYAGEHDGVNDSGHQVAGCPVCRWISESWLEHMRRCPDDVEVAYWSHTYKNPDRQLKVATQST